MNPKQTHILGCKVDLVSKQEMRGHFSRWLEGKMFHHIVTLNPEICLLGYKDRNYHKILKHTDLTVADGIGLQLGALILGTTPPKRITGREVLDSFCRLAVENQKSIYLVGGGAGIAKKAKKKLKELYPKLRIAGAEEGIKKGEFAVDTPDLVDRINKSKASIVLVAFGAPKQEQWISHNRKKLKNVRIAVGIGGLFDYLAEVVPTPPPIVAAMGLEWLFRLITQPDRWNRIFSATIVFLGHILRWKFNMSFIYRENVLGLIQNNKGKILLVTPAWSSSIKWQFPQGGVDEGEKPEQAILREMSEELGTDKFKIIKHHPAVYRYKWPKWYRLLMGKRGQKQDLFILKFTGINKDIKLREEELADWRWCDRDTVVEELYPSRKEVGKIVLKLLKKA